MSKQNMLIYDYKSTHFINYLMHISKIYINNCKNLYISDLNFLIY
jgi:hypothetical protein